MNKENQRIAIAKAMGWTPYSEEENPHFFFHPGRKGWRELYHTQEIPDYLNDLNAMHEAEKVLPDYKLLRWHGHLLNACGRSVNASRATAAQRAEAFLRTLGLWEES